MFLAIVLFFRNFNVYEGITTDNIFCKKSYFLPCFKDVDKFPKTYNLCVVVAFKSLYMYAMICDRIYGRL